MTTINLYKEDVKIAEMEIESDDENNLESRSQPIIISLEWFIKEDQDKIELLQNISDSKLLHGRKPPSLDDLLNSPYWEFPSLNDLVYSLSSLDDIYSFDFEDLPDIDILPEEGFYLV